LRCIVDANVLIDLNRGDILPRLFDLPLRFAVPDGVLDELVEPDRKLLQDMGLERTEMTPDQILEAAQMSAMDPHLSLGDCTAFVAARDEQALLLTGDAALRTLAEQAGVTVHGVLWVLDEFEAARLLTGLELAACLRQMLAEGARLPLAECEARLERWGRG
jgi:predicted nucleic acid-binding protein